MKFLKNTVCDLICTFCFVPQDIVVMLIKISCCVREKLQGIEEALNLLSASLHFFLLFLLLVMCKYACGGVGKKEKIFLLCMCTLSFMCASLCLLSTFPLLRRCEGCCLKLSELLV